MILMMNPRGDLKVVLFSAASSNSTQIHRMSCCPEVAQSSGQNVQKQKKLLSDPCKMIRVLVVLAAKVGNIKSQNLRSGAVILAVRMVFVDSQPCGLPTNPAYELQDPVGKLDASAVWFEHMMLPYIK